MGRWRFLLIHLSIYLSIIYTRETLVVTWQQRKTSKKRKYSLLGRLNFSANLVHLLNIVLEANHCSRRCGGEEIKGMNMRNSLIAIPK